MAAKNSMNGYIDRAVKRYSALFTLPSHKTLLLALFAVCLLNGILFLAAFQSPPSFIVVFGLALGTTFFALTLASDFLIHLSSLKTDPIFNMRRSSALSFYSLLFWLPFNFIGAVANPFSPGIWFKFFSVGVGVALALRLLVFSAVSFAGTVKTAFFSLLPPVLYVFSVVYTAFTVSTFSFDASLLPFFLISIVVTVAAVSVYLFSINRVGFGLLGVGTFSVLKAFMANWTENLNTPFERLFERFSQERKIQLSILSFRNAAGVKKATIVVPSFHPGPFKNIGSSALPYHIQKTLESKMDNGVVLVPHGLSGHDLDLATQTQNQLVIEKILGLSNVSGFGAKATKRTNVKKDGASVGCQVINNCAFTTLTLAPETMEDLPPELNTLISEAANKNGLSAAIAVDAHNSIQGPFKTDEVIKPLQEAALASLEQASKLQRVSFQIGVARVKPKEFGLEEGMGPGGIAALVVRVDDQTTAYVTIDGNNMISGLREKILEALSEIGVNEGEVLTTDTHMVNAVVLNARGYHPVGEAMDQETLIRYVKQATANALANLEPAEAAWGTDTVPKVKVIGEKQIEAMSILVDKAMRRAKKLAVSVFPLAGVILAVLFLLL